MGYYLDEEKGWEANMEEMERSLSEAKSSGINVRAFVLINPGNPTGQVLPPNAVASVVKFCHKHGLVLLADEVYQENVYCEGKIFTSCKKAAVEEGLEGKVEIVSFHSTSKGIYGECGRRGGYMELTGFQPSVFDQVYKLASSGLCSGLPGQVMTSLMVKGPEKGGESYESYMKEKDAIFKSLSRRAQLVASGLDSIPGFKCTPSEGAMYCFPRVDIPVKAKEEAERRGEEIDTMYALSLLRETGICVVPASGFGQEEGRNGFRTTFLPKEEEMERAVGMFRKHHEGFVEKYK